MVRLKVEIASTPLSLAHGLMFRKSMASDEGMLFKFPSLTQPAFWGKNTYIPLDLAFVNDDNVITSIKRIVPMSTNMVRSSDFCRLAIEANAGFFANHGIKVGSKISIKGMNNAAEVTFV